MQLGLHEIKFSRHTFQQPVPNTTTTDSMSQFVLAWLRWNEKDISSYLQLEFQVAAHGLEEQEAHSHGCSKKRQSLCLQQLKEMPEKCQCAGHPETTVISHTEAQGYSSMVTVNSPSMEFSLHKRTPLLKEKIYERPIQQNGTAMGT